LAGTWSFVAFPGVRPSLLTPGSIPDNRHDIVIFEDGSYRWGRWSGSVEGADGEFSMYLDRPLALRRRFDDYNAVVSLLLEGDELEVWLPDLGIDRDIDRGAAGEDIDDADMLFRRVSS